MTAPLQSGNERAQVREAHRFIERHTQERQVNKVLHGFPSPRFWQERNVPVRDVMTRRKTGGGRNRLHLYVATPYCLRTEPDRCGYCLFPVEVFTGMGQLDRYLDYLEREGVMYREFFEGDHLSSIYFGGGTSNLYKAEQYSRLMGIVRQVFPDLEGITITLEGIPQLFTREKLRRMKESGINRISMGAQQLNDELNKLSGRKQTVGHTLNTIEWCQQLGLPCNVDLIYGWPRQTLDSMMRDLELLVSTGVNHVTHYELNVGGPSDFALNRRHELPTIVENLQMYRAAKTFLESRGFRQLTPYDWERAEVGVAERPLYEECVRGFGDYEMWGWGFAGLSEMPGASDAPGWTYLNHRAVSDYFVALDQGVFPVERGFHYAAEDLRLSALFRNLQGMEADRASYLGCFKVDPVEEHRPIWQALSERSWVEITERKITVVGDGVFYTPLIQTLLATARLGELRELTSSRGASIQI